MPRLSRLAPAVAGALLLLPSCGDDAADDARDAAITYPDPFTIEAFDDVRIHSRDDIDGQENVRAADTAIDLGDGPFARVTLEVELRTTCFPFAQWADDPPPEGQNWPASCDAFDRNFEFELDPPVEEGDPPAIELVRSITPFGGPMDYAVDITDVANGRPGAHTLRGRITTFSDGAGIVSGSNGGWNLTARIVVEPGPPPRDVVFVEPLLRTSLRRDTAEQQLPFTVPEAATSIRVEYRVTGHGGDRASANFCQVGQDPRTARCCIGGSEEFCARAHAIGFDGDLTESFVPWVDCVEDFDACGELLLAEIPGLGTRQYCERNPQGSIQSVRAPRANWCPNRVTPPLVFEPDLAPGAHTFDMVIGQVGAGSWVTSVLVLGYAE